MTTRDKVVEIIRLAAEIENELPLDFVQIGSPEWPIRTHHGGDNLDKIRTAAGNLLVHLPRGY